MAMSTFTKLSTLPTLKEDTRIWIPWLLFFSFCYQGAEYSENYCKCQDNYRVCDYTFDVLV